MRADRLLSILLMLQNRGKVTASRLAEEMEVSVRTIYRDLDALSAAGIPVYIERGPLGGCALVEGYRTHLTGLNQAQVKALFMLSVPASLDQLGVSRDLKTALDKLAAALPPQYRQDERKVHQRVYLDWTDWSHGPAGASLLPLIYQAVWEDRQLAITYNVDFGPPGRMPFQRIVEPYGLVAKAGEWQLVAANGGPTERGCLQVYNLSQLLKAVPLDARFERPPDFDLTLYWQNHCSELAMNRPSFPVTLRISTALAAQLNSNRDQLQLSGPPDPKGYRQTTLLFETFEEARRQVLSFGRAAEVVEPEALRRSVIDYARQIVAFYSD
jgi:predicted DNA-binding transcriptional regulator YafY